MGSVDGLSGLVLWKDSLHTAFVDRDRLVRGHLGPFSSGLDLAGLEEVEDTEAVVRFTDSLVANWAGHSVGDT